MARQKTFYTGNKIFNTEHFLSYLHLIKKCPGDRKPHSFHWVLNTDCIFRRNFLFNKNLISLFNFPSLFFFFFLVFNYSMGLELWPLPLLSEVSSWIPLDVSRFRTLSEDTKASNSQLIDNFFNWNQHKCSDEPAGITYLKSARMVLQTCNSVWSGG